MGIFVDRDVYLRVMWFGAEDCRRGRWPDECIIECGQAGPRRYQCPASPGSPGGDGCGDSFEADNRRGLGAPTPEGDTPPAACLSGLYELTSKRLEQVAPTLVLGSEPERDEVHGRFL